ncbi:MAG TPA: LysR family transcriptional regulator [Stellaceae bacterium]|nr:LysR family transcriptional regulator [Stellaceae bacterium]
MPPARPRERRASRYFRMRDLELLSALARHASMAKAARELAISQPAVSKAAADLEAALGVKLLDRGFGGVQMTPYGELVARSADTTLSELRQCLRDLDGLADPEAGEVRIGAPEAVSAGFLADAVMAFTQAHPRAFVEIVAARTVVGDYRELRDKRVDLMVGRVPGNFASEEIAVDMLFTERRFVVGATCSRWARRRAVALADLREAPWVVATPGEAEAELGAAFQSCGIEPPRARVIAQSPQLRRKLLVSGEYLALLSIPAIQAFIDEDAALKLLPIDLSLLDSPFAVFTLRNRSLSPVVENFIASLRPAAAALERRYRRTGNASRR